MTSRHCIYLLTICLIVSCKATIDRQQEINIFKNSLDLYLTENHSSIDKLNEQTKTLKEAAIYRDFATTLNSVIEKCIDTTFKNIDVTILKTKISSLNIDYQNKIDSIIKTIDYKIFPELDYQFIKSVKFDVVNVFKNDDLLNCYFTYEQILQKHYQVLQLTKIYTSHGL